MKNLVIIDTVGRTSLFHLDFVKRYPFVKSWQEHRPAGLKETSQHPHGGMVLDKALLPLWDAKFPFVVHLVQIFNARGDAIDSGLMSGWLINVVEDIRRSGPTWVNNSWGSYLGATMPVRSLKSNAMAWRKLILRGGIYVAWAAGNSGDYNPDEDRDYPQSMLTDISDKIGAADLSGRTSSYSGDSITAPPLGVYWATDVLLANPNTGKADTGSGTSFASPKHVGLMMKRDLMSRDAILAFAGKAQRPSDVPRSNLPHPKWGMGWLEDEYQKEILRCPYLLEARAKPQTRLSCVVSNCWFDFRQATQYEYSNSVLRDGSG